MYSGWSSFDVISKVLKLQLTRKRDRIPVTQLRSILDKNRCETIDPFIFLAIG